MNNRLYIGNLNAKINENALFALFGTVGKVLSVMIPSDHQTGARKNYGFIEMESAEQAQAAAETLNGHSLSGRELKVSHMMPAAPRDPADRESNPYRAKRTGWGNNRRPTDTPAAAPAESAPGESIDAISLTD